MAKNQNDNKNGKKENGSGLKTQTKHGILALFFLMAAFNITGVAGHFIYEKLYYLLGFGYILLPALLVLLGASFVKSETPEIGWTRAISATMFLLSGLGVIDIVSGSHKGGLLGEILSTPFMSLFDTYASIIFLGAILIISILVIFDAKLDMALLFKKLWNLIKKEKNTEPVEVKESTAEVAEDEKETTGEKIKKALGIHKNINKEDEEEEMPIKKRKGGLVSTYVPPPLSLLEED